MLENKSHIIIIDGPAGVGKKTFCFELAIALIYSKLKTALVVSPDSSLYKTIKTRQANFPYLPTPEIISEKDFYQTANNYDAVIVADIKKQTQLKTMAHTFITIVPQSKSFLKNFQNDKMYINMLWELKKQIASEHHHMLNWVICENNLKEKTNTATSPELTKIAKMYGFRTTPPLHFRKAYQTNITGISAQDKAAPELNKQMTYDDICAKREIIKLAEFIFS